MLQPCSTGVALFLNFQIPKRIYIYYLSIIFHACLAKIFDIK